MRSEHFGRIPNSGQDIERADLRMLVEDWKAVCVGELSPDLREAAKRLLIDSLGVMFAGSSAPGIGALIEWVRREGGAARAGVPGLGTQRFAPSQAALLGGTFGHACDFDDTHDEAAVHASSAVVGAALAVCQDLGGKC